MSNTDTKNKIIETTIDVIASSGIHSATAGNISKKGSFQKSIIFYHFDNVDNLLLQALIKSLNEINPLLSSNNYSDYDSFYSYMSSSINDLLDDSHKIKNLKVILSFAHQTMYLKDFLKDLRNVVFDDLNNSLIKSISYFNKKNIEISDIEVMASLLMATFNGLGVLLLINGSNNKFIENWEMQVKLVSSYIE